MQRNENPITVVLCVNGDGLHAVPVSYIGYVASPRCFRDSRFNVLKTQYSNQANAWIDSTHFQKWINWWYSEVRKKTNAEILVIMDNCGGHELDADLSGLRIEFLPPKSTHKYQTLDLCLISDAKVRYRSLLLRQIFDDTITWNSEESHFPLSCNSGKFGVRDGHMPQVGDAMSLFNDSWSKTKRTTILRCWIKRKCLSDSQIKQARNICSNLSQNETDEVQNAPVSHKDAQSTFEDLSTVSCIQGTNLRAQDLIAELQEVENSLNYYKYSTQK